MWRPFKKKIQKHFFQFENDIQDFLSFYSFAFFCPSTQSTNLANRVAAEEDNNTAPPRQKLLMRSLAAAAHWWTRLLN